MGIRRADGRAATRNYIGIITSVNCSAHVADLIATAFRRNPLAGHDPLAEWPNVDGVVALTHKTGCGMTAGEPLTLLRRTLGGFARHANFSHVIGIGLGCEVNQIGGLLQEQRLSGRLRSMDIQEMGGTRKTVEAGHRLRAGGAGRGEPRGARAGAGERTDRRAAMRRLRRLFRHHGQPGAGRGERPRGAAWRRGDPLRDARDLRRGAPVHPPRGQSRGRREAGRIDALVGTLLRARRRGDGRESIARQQARRAHHHPGEVARRYGEGGHHQPRGGAALRRAGDEARLPVHGHARLRPGRRDRARSRAAPTCSASPPAAAASSAASRRPPSSSPPTRRCTSACRTTWTSTAAAS